MQTVHSFTIIGIQAHPVKVSATIEKGTPTFDVHGIPEQAIRELRVRVRSALEQSGLPFPMKRVTVNVEPSIFGNASGIDLPVAMAILAAAGHTTIAGKAAFVGELSLTGAVRPVRGVLSMALRAKALEYERIFVPLSNAAEVADVIGIDVCVIDRLYQPQILAVKDYPRMQEEDDRGHDLQDVRGQESAKRALEVAAAGEHNTLLAGPPGSGKTILARMLEGLLPPMTEEEKIETTCAHSVAGLLREGRGIMQTRPFRAPHHTASSVGLLGGGSGSPRPGEVSLAQNGVLFLDELPEFASPTLQGLSGVVETDEAEVHLVRNRVKMPAKFMLVASMNSCPCGPTATCSCTSERIARYRGRVRNFVAENIQIVVRLETIRLEDLSAAPVGSTSAHVRERVMSARKAQMDRQGITNARIQFGLASLDSRDERARINSRVARLIAEDARELIQQAIPPAAGSTAAYFKALRVARTIADLAGSEQILSEHAQEAVSLALAQF